MALTAGTRLGPYEIADQLGAGGMGEVYRATDTRLDRAVAIKVLPEHLADDPQRRERFEREARAVSSLNHPHICTLHDVGEQDGVHYLVMDLVEGETLQQRLEKGRLPVDQALEYAIQIADALDKAHRQGVVHRDLKPGNIMITKSGTKLLDFGLAKLRGDAGEVSPLSQMPTQDPSAPLTAEGTIIGTLQYMAPEQLEGKESDARTDIFAFGAVVYEMVTGKKAFEGASQASLITAIMGAQPVPIAEIQPVSPAALDWSIGRCLQKDPEDRWQSARDLMEEISRVRRRDDSTVPASSRKGRTRERVFVTVSVIVGLTAAFSLYLGSQRQSDVERVLQFSVNMPNGVRRDISAAFGDAALSPDGESLVFLASDSAGRRLLYLRPLDSSQAVPLAGTEDPSFPFWSPAGRFIGFGVDDKLYTVAVAGGPVTLVTESGRLLGGSWNLDGTIIFGRQLGGIYQVASSGGEPSPVTSLDRSRFETDHRFPTFLPDGKSFIYFISAAQASYSGIYASPLDSEERVRISDAQSNALYASDHLLYARNGSLLAQPFDPERLTLTGEPFMLADHVRHNLGGGFYTAYTVSDEGLLAYMGETQPRLTWYDRQGQPTKTVGTQMSRPSRLSLSPDEERVAFHVFDPEAGISNLWLLDTVRDTSIQLTTSHWNIMPIWAPDSRRIVFDSLRDGPFNIYEVSAAGGEETLLVEATHGRALATDWSNDGSLVVYEQRSSRGDHDLWLLPMEGNRTPIAFLTSEFEERQGRLSPDGKWIAYTSTASGGNEVYVRSMPSVEDRPAVRKGVSTQGGLDSQWRRDGRELFYLDPSGRIMSVDIEIGESDIEIGEPRLLFDAQANSNEWGQNYAVSSDGERFLVISYPRAGSDSIEFIQNWPGLLEENQ